MPSRALAKLARRDGSDPWFRLAILSSVNGRAGEVFRLLIADQEFRASGHGRELLGDAGDADRQREPQRTRSPALVQGIDALPEGEKALGRDLVRSLVAKLPAGRPRASSPGCRAARPGPSSPTCSATPGRPPPTRTPRGRPGGGGPHARPGDRSPTSRTSSRTSLTSRQPQPVQAAALETLSRLRPAGRPGAAARGLAGAEPAAAGRRRRGALRPAGLGRGLPRRGRAGQGQPRRRGPGPHPGAPGACRRPGSGPAPPSCSPRRGWPAARTWSPPIRKRSELKGDPARGKAVFKKECSACHQLEGVGTDRRRPDRHPRPGHGGGAAQHPRPQPRGQAAVPQLRPGDRRRPHRHGHDHRGDRQQPHDPPGRRHQRRRSCGSTSRSCGARACRSCRRGWRSRSTCRRWRTCWRT